MAYNTAIFQGNFTSTAANVFIPLRGGVDWFEVWNQSLYATPVNSTGYYYRWQKGMPNGQGLYEAFTAAAPAVTVGQLAANTGFFYQDTSTVTYTFSPASNIAVTAGAGATVTWVAHGLAAGDIIRFANLPAAVQPLAAIDWVVSTITDADNFVIPTAASNVGVGATAGASLIKISRESLYVPQDRVITAIASTANAQISFAAPHGFQVGQEIRINVNSITNPAVASYLKATYGASPSLNPVAIVKSVVSSVAITINLDLSAMPAFAFPLTASVPFTPSQATPIGIDTATALSSNVNILSDATNNIGQIGMLLVGGSAISPAGGTAGNQMFWQAGVSFSVNNAF